MTSPPGPARSGAPDSAAARLAAVSAAAEADVLRAQPGWMFMQAGQPAAGSKLGSRVQAWVPGG